ncbi:MAG TPA: AsmA family protein, partial [Thermodesulfovibrionales bacterium]|nr:AsmA family protein [Thermodesulfovibrionales bacterium]
MKKKLLYAGGIIAAIIVVVFVGLAIVVKSYLKSDSLKAVIIPKIEEFTGRKAGISDIDVSLFKGIDVKGISLMDKEGKGEFLKVKEFVLAYSLLPLLHKQIVIRKIEVISPSVSLVQEKDGTYNFSDILEKAKATKKEPKSTTEAEGLPFSVLTDKIVVKDAMMTFSDAQGVIPSISLVSNIDLKVTAEKGVSPEISGKMDVKTLTVKMGDNEIKGAGTIGIGKDAIDLDLSSTVGKDTIKLSGNVKDYRNVPVVRLDANAKELDLDRLLAMAGGSKGSAAPQKEKRVSSGKTEKAREGKAGSVSASGEIRIASASYEGYLLKDFAARYSYAKE